MDRAGHLPDGDAPPTALEPGPESEPAPSPAPAPSPRRLPPVADGATPLAPSIPAPAIPVPEPASPIGSNDMSADLDADVAAAIAMSLQQPAPSSAAGPAVEVLAHAVTAPSPNTAIGDDGSSQPHSPAQEHETKTQTETALPAQHGDPAAREPVSDCYYTRTIEFGNRRCSVICQNGNGPCPLLALCNCLLLRGTIAIHPDRSIVEFGLLVEMLTDVLLAKASQYSANPEAYEQMVQSTVELFPTLQHGLDVNVRFDGCKGFEFTRQLELFDIFRVGIYHGWVIDPQDAEATAAIGSTSYNQLVEMIIGSQGGSGGEGGETPTSEDVQRGSTAEGWLSANPSQLTHHGICELHAAMGNLELGVLFRNNHFFCVLKRGQELLTLVTDQGFAATPAVWETLAAVNGDSIFLDQTFRSLDEGGGGAHQQPPMAGAGAGSGGGDTVGDPAADALELQKMYDAKNAGRPAPAPQPSPAELQAMYDAKTAERAKTGTVLADDEALARQLQREMSMAAPRGSVVAAVAPEAGGRAAVAVGVSDADLALQLQQQEQSAAFRQSAPTRTADGGFYRGPDDDYTLAARLQAEEQERAQANGQQQRRSQRSGPPKKKSDCLLM